MASASARRAGTDWTWATLGLALLLGPPSWAQGDPDGGSSTVQVQLTRYEALGRAFLDASAAAPVEELAAQARVLLEVATPLLGDFAIRYPSCGPYLKAALALDARLAEITPEELERDFHADAALPDAPGFCYHVKDLLVHPASVLVWLRALPDEADARLRAAAEMREALAHVAAVRQLFDLAEP